MPRIAVIADDLSGAVESAAAFMLRTTRISVTLAGRPQAHAAREDGVAPAADVQVVDTDSRELAPSDAAARVADVVAALADVPVLVKKIDSLLRGNVAAELHAVRTARPNLVVAPALPATGRAIRDGRVWVGDRLLHETDVWRAEKGERPLSVGHVLAPLPVVTVPLGTVRSPGLAAQLREIVAAGQVPVCDGEIDDDLDRVVAAIAGLDRPVLVGSAGIAAAAARALTGTSPARAATSTHRSGPVLAVVGSAAPGIGDQLAALSAAGAEIVALHPDELRAADGQTAAMAALVARLAAVTAPVVVVTVDDAGGVDPLLSRVISRTLTAAVSELAGRAAGLVLTGGETARAVLDRLGVTALTPLTQVHHGAVVCLDDTGRAVATRPGSFGGPDSLVQLVTAVQDAVAEPAAAAASPVRSAHEDFPSHPPEESA